MKLTTQRMLGLLTSCLRAFVVILGFVVAAAIVSAQENKPVDEAAKSVEAPAVTPTPANPVAEASKMPDISGIWRNRKDPQSAGIVIRRVEDGTGDFRFEDRPDRLIPSAPIKWSSSTQLFEQLMFDPKQKEPAKRTLQLLADGKTLRITVSFDEALQKELVKNGSITEAEQKELLNQEWVRTKPPVEVPARPTAAVVEADEPVDPLKPGRVGLEPATPLTKQIVELFGPRGAKVLDYEEGKRLHIELPLDLANDLEKLLKLVADESRKQAKPGPKQAAENSYAVALEPATPLAKSLVELFGDRGAKVLEFQAGKRLKVEAPGDVFLDLEKVLQLVANETQKQEEIQRAIALTLFGPGEQPSSKLGGEGFGVPTERMESKNILVKATVDGLAFFSKPLGKWSHLRVSQPTFGGSLFQQIVVAAELAVTRNDEAFYGFSSRTGRFAKLAIPKELNGAPKVFAEVSEDSALVQLGDETYVMTAQSGKWSSPNSAAQSDNNEAENRPDLAVVRLGLAIPDTPAAKQLVEQLHAQESAAAAEAAAIRQLQADGQAESNKQPIAEHQRKLKNLLSTAFDLKLQLEELQVQELQSRLSRLERQIGQRKELREKIIARRAGELIEGDALRWDSTASAPTKLLGSADGNIRNSAKTTTPAAVAILRERFGELWDDLRSGKAKPDAVLPAINELAQAEPEAHAQHVELLQGLLELVRRLQSTDSVSKAEVLEIEAAYEKARSLNGGAGSKTSPSEPPEFVEVKPEADDIVVDLYAGSQVLPGLQRNPGYLKLVQSLNALKGVMVNIREVGNGDSVLMAMVRDPSQRCQKEMQRTGKESVLRAAINSALKAGGIENVRWEESRDVTPADPSNANGTTTKSEPLPSSEELRRQLQPFAERVSVAEGSVRELEAAYLRDRSNATELQRAIEEMTAARFEYRSRLTKYVPSIKRLGSDIESLNEIVSALSQKHRAMIQSLSEGKGSEAEVKAASDAWKRAKDTATVAETTLNEYLSVVVRQLVPGASSIAQIEQVEGPKPYSPPPAVPQPGYHPDVALAWLEAAMDLKLEFVQFDGLKLPFNAALRIREATGEYTTNDLIVALYGKRFDSLDQAVVVLKNSVLDGSQQQVVDHKLDMLRGGLAGQPEQLSTRRPWPIAYLEPSHANANSLTDIPFEVRVRKKDAADAVTEYVTGVCVSPNGLVVIPVAAPTLVEGDAIVPFGQIKGTARVVASDDKHGLTLVKLELLKSTELFESQLLPWIKCRAGMPAVGQRLSLPLGPNRGTQEVSVIEVNRPFEKLLVGNDGFLVTTTTSWQVRRGSPLISVEGELQGIIAFSALNASENKPLDGLTDRSVALPAVHIQKLLDEYRRSTAKQKPESQPVTQQTNRGDEQTFDGTPYSQWLKMLETERKPNKLATAMEACARLAATGDEPRIARGLFVAAKLFESTDNTKERDLVFNAGTAALKRLPGEAVVAELLAALHDEQFKDAREFQCRFLITVAGNTNSSTPNSLKAAFKSHDQELVTTLLKLAQATEDRSPSSENSRLLAGAASVWLISERKLSEFDGLRPLVMAGIDEVYSRTTGRIDRREQPWFSGSSRLVATEPETPGLATLLAKHIDKDRTQILGRLKAMGTHAEPAVPLLIEDFLVHWKSREDELRAGAANDEQAATQHFYDRYGDVPLSAEERMADVLNVLGAIGPKAKSAAPLLRQIAVLATSKSAGTPSLNDRLFDAVKKTLALIGEAAAEPQEAPMLLSEFSRLQGCWNLSSLTPKADHKDIQFEFSWQLSIEDKHVRGNFDVVRKVMNHIGANSNSMHYRINDTVTPRQIELIDREQRHRQLGIYELQGHRLKIELAKPGLPRLKEFSADPNKLPEGHVLLELERDSNE